MMKSWPENWAKGPEPSTEIAAKCWCTVAGLAVPVGVWEMLGGTKWALSSTEKTVPRGNAIKEMPGAWGRGVWCSVAMPCPSLVPARRVDNVSHDIGQANSLV